MSLFYSFYFLGCVNSSYAEARLDLSMIVSSWCNCLRSIGLPFFLKKNYLLQRHTMGAENGKQVLRIWLADANTTKIRNQKCWFSISLLLVPLMSLYVVPKIIHTKAQYTQQIKKLFNARESWMMQKWINWSESCLLASLTESKMDYLIRTLPVCITHWVKKGLPNQNLVCFHHSLSQKYAGETFQ